jgi:GTP cyclohydrolase I
MTCCDHDHNNKSDNTHNKPISEVIKTRLLESGTKFFSNDNISEHIKPGEIDLLVDEVAEKFKGVLESLVIDVENDHNTGDTAHRVAKMYVHEVFSGRYYNAPKVTTFPNAGNYDQLYMVGPIEIRSTCAHHFQPITGNAYIAVFPGKNVVGLSKFNRIADWVASRPTIQEELVIQIADEVEKITEAEGVAVVVKAEHGCMINRGVKAHESDMLTSVMRGKFRDDVNLKNEFITLLQGMKGFNS